jgi:hypothetical protein
VDLRKLDLFLHIPSGASAYAAELFQNTTESIPAPPLDVQRFTTAGIAIMESITQTQMRPLEQLTLRITCRGFEDRAQAYLIHATIQIGRSSNKNNYEFRAAQLWGLPYALGGEVELEGECLDT